MADIRAPDYSDKTDEAVRPPPQMGPRTAPALEPNEARQATTHHNVRYVLAVSLGLLVIAYVIVYFVFFAGSAPPTIPAG